jgi:IclR family transcriptional regulator, acetate operon repressor
MVKDGRYRVRSVERALDLLALLGAAGPDGETVSELARRAGVSKATAYATLQTLLARGFVADRETGQSRRYRLGMELARLGDRAAFQTSIADIALPALRGLTDATGRPARLAVLDEGAAVVIGRVDAPGIVQFRAHLGRREHAHTSGVGKALLATLPEDQVATIAARTKLPRRTARSITTLGDLLADLARVRTRGWAVDDEEDADGVLCVGSSVHGVGGGCVGAISITGLKLDLGEGDVAELGAQVRAVADRISILLGGPTFAERFASRDPATIGATTGGPG